MKDEFSPKCSSIYNKNEKKSLENNLKQSKRCEISEDRKAVIESNVEKLLKKIKYEDKKDSIDIIKIAHKLGFVIVNAELDGGEDGFLIVEEGAYKIMGIKTDRLIGVNANRIIEWKRFVIAHEIAHYMMQYKEGKTQGMYAHREHKIGKNYEENEADYYAANLLMPKEKFICKYKQYSKDNMNEEELIINLSRSFAVTKKMIERRIEELDLNEDK